MASIRTPLTTRSPSLAQAAGTARSGPVPLQTGFRPFFLLAAGFAGLVVPALLLVLQGEVGLASPLPLFTWHGHEMLFGFTGAVLAGFLLTAAEVWTGRATARGWGLLGLVALWLAGRVTASGVGPAGLAAGLNVGFFVVLAGVLLRPILLARGHRNLPFPLLLLVLAGAQAAIWAAALGHVSFALAQRAEWVATDAVVLVIALIGGRIIPMFTRNRLRGLTPRAPDVRDRLAFVALSALALGHALGMEGGLLTALLAVAGVLQLVRLWGWGGVRAIREAPFVGVLHVGYALLGVGLLLEAAVSSAGRHLLNLGGISLLCLAMMARVSLGHTGRPLQPRPGTVVACVLLVVAAALRTLWSLVEVEGLRPYLLAGSGLVWSVAFVVFVIGYGPMLLTPRADGAPG